MPKKYPLEFKKQAIRRYEKGESIPALCQELHISQSTFYHWRNQYRSIQTSAHTYTPAEFDVLVRRLQKAEHKLSIIQLSGYLSKVPLQDKLATLEHFHNEMSDLYSVHELCEALNVSRGTFYNHIFRRADRSKYESEKAHLMLKVKQIFDDSEQRYGADKIRAVLAENGLRISTKRVLSIMQELGLHSIRADAKKVYKNQMRKKQNLLHRKFTTDHPNQVWVSDITYFKIKNAWVYLCAIIDLFSRKVVGYRVSHAASTRLVTTTFRNAYEERGNPKNLTFHSDRGGQYISAAFSKLLQQYNVKQSFSASGTPLDNAVAETFFATFKKEETYRREYTSERHFRKSVDEYGEVPFFLFLIPHSTNALILEQLYLIVLCHLSHLILSWILSRVPNSPPTHPAKLPRNRRCTTGRQHRGTAWCSPSGGAACQRNRHRRCGAYSAGSHCPYRSGDRIFRSRHW